MAKHELCHCGDRFKARCPGEWEPGCDLGNNPNYAAVHTPLTGHLLNVAIWMEDYAAHLEIVTTVGSVRLQMKVGDPIPDFIFAVRQMLYRLEDLNKHAPPR